MLYAVCHKILYVAIHRFSGAGAPRIDLFTLGGSDAQYQVATGSINDPAAASGALAVGAVCWQTGNVEAFSSQGPTIDGRVKPDLAATDRMSSGIYGPFDSCTGSSGFAGTSAASPTVAGMAALVSQLYPSASLSQLRGYLISHAVDEGPVGTDSLYGAGEALLPSALSIPQNVVAPAAVGMPTPGNTLTAGNGTCTGDGESRLQRRVSGRAVTRRARTASRSDWARPSASPRPTSALRLADVGDRRLCGRLDLGVRSHSRHRDHGSAAERQHADHPPAPRSSGRRSQRKKGRGTARARRRTPTTGKAATAQPSARPSERRARTWWRAPTSAAD